jgi:hypothetical protein
MGSTLSQEQVRLADGGVRLGAVRERRVPAFRVANREVLVGVVDGAVRRRILARGEAGRGIRRAADRRPLGRGLLGLSLGWRLVRFHGLF